MKFVKMHGLGNDYVYVDTFETPVRAPEKLAVQVSRPHFGVGADGLILIGPSEIADARMRIFNADGSEAEMCGNGLRCTARYLYETSRTHGDAVTVETGAGLRRAEILVENGRVRLVRADMGEPVLDGARIPVDGYGNRVYLPLADGSIREFTCVSMGNPHAVLFVREAEPEWCRENGRMLEKDRHFPMRTNVEFVRVLARDHLRVFVWERGSGATLACGTGACASLVAAVLNGLAERAAKVELPGGTLQIEWRVADNRVYMTGPAAISFYGDWPEAEE